MVFRLLKDIFDGKRSRVGKGGGGGGGGGREREREKTLQGEPEGGIEINKYCNKFHNEFCLFLYFFFLMTHEILYKANLFHINNYFTFRTTGEGKRRKIE